MQIAHLLHTDRSQLTVHESWIRFPAGPITVDALFKQAEHRSGQAFNMASGITCCA